MGEVLSLANVQGGDWGLIQQTFEGVRVAICQRQEQEASQQRRARV